MKKTFLSLAFMLIGTFAFASNADTQNTSTLVESITNHQELENLKLDASNFDIFSVEEDFFKECHVKIKGTINGQKVDIDVTFTSDSGSCIQDTVKLLKDVAESK